MQTLPPLSVVTRPAAAAIPSAGAKPLVMEPELPAFSPGQTLRAVVVAENAENLFTLETGGSRFTVQSKVALAPGQALHLQVLSTEPKIELQISEDTAVGLFSRSLASAGGNRDLSSFLTLLRQVAPSQLPNIGESSLQALQQFTQLQEQLADLAGRAANTAQPGEAGPNLLQRLFSQLAAQMAPLAADGQNQAVPAAARATLQDIAQLLQGENQLPQAVASQLDQLTPQARQAFDLISLLQPNNEAAQPGTPEETLGQLLQNLRLQPDVPTVFASLKSGLAELISLLQGPENLLRPSSNVGPQGGLLPKGAEAVPAQQDGSAGGGKTDGERLQQLVARLGINLEGLLARGDRQEAVKTVKFALLELVQNAAGDGKLVESGRQALKTLEFFQLAQQQAARQDALVVPLPLPFLEQGYLVVEDYGDQSDQAGGGREMPKRFSLYLKLEPLGNLRIDCLFGEEGLYIRFFSESKKISEFLAARKDELKGAITDQLVQGVSFAEHAEDPLAAVLKKCRPADQSLIQTKA